MVTFPVNRDGPLRLRSARSTELAPLQERSGAIRKNGGAGAESERVFLTEIGAGAESERLFIFSSNHSSIFRFTVL
jgi:hypothetical protein